ncbi:hypothetical protein [Nocardia callitridis]|uniref:DUF732 domain-containing protein n=1 Tax=Nocardia callitridis TaxID=648753 RepID=A0ABP9KEZ7_9NOCA
MDARRLFAALFASLTVGASLVGTSAAAEAAPQPNAWIQGQIDDQRADTQRPDPWVQGQIDSQTEDVPGFLAAINNSGTDRGGISDRDLAIKGRSVCGQIYGARGDLSGASLPNADDLHSQQIVAAASVKYLCPPAADYFSSDLLDQV